MKRFLPLLLLTLSLTLARAADLTFYVGTYSKGVYKCTVDSETGKFGSMVLAAEAQSPSFVNFSTDGKFLYAGSDGKGGSAIAFKVEKDGMLTLLNQQPTGKGGGVTHIWYDDATKTILTASYGGGSISAFKVKEDGALSEPTGFAQFEGTGPNKNRQEKPHAHSIYSHAPVAGKAGSYVYTCDLGTDKLWIFTVDKEGKLTPNDPPFSMVPPGSGPRHLAFSPDGKHAYVANEMGHTVTVLNFEEKNGALTQIQDISSFPAGFDYKGEMTVAEIYFHPTGKWLYVSNRDVGNQGHDSVAVYSVAADGKLTWIQDVTSPVKFPRGFGLDPAGQWLVVAGQNDGKISSLKIDQATGKLTPTGEFTETGTPVCIQFAPTK